VTVMENVVKHKSSRYSGRIDFNKCPEILFSELKKGLVRTTYANSSRKNMQINSEVKSYKSQETAKAKKPQKPSNQNNVNYTPSICITLTLFYIFSSETGCYRKMTLLHNIYFYLRSHWEKFSLPFIVFTFCSKGHILIQVSHANFFTFLTIFGHSFCLLYQIQGNSKNYHTSFGTFLMHF